jgi:(p)ppGpp synthase/HD superfamily hydrolase
MLPPSIATQLRKGTSIPYLSHLMAVSALVLEHGGDEEQAIAGLLHDAAEDQGGETTLREIERRYGNDVARIVADCTDAWTEPRPPWRQRKEAYLAKLPTKPARSLLVSLADKAHNASAILRDYRVLGERLWERFNGGRPARSGIMAPSARSSRAASRGRLQTSCIDRSPHFPAGDQADRGRTAWNAGIKQAS